MTSHFTDGFEARPASGWHHARCTCGWTEGPFPDAETMVDALRAALREDSPHKRGDPINGPERPCPACGAMLAPSETHWSIIPAPMGGYICPEDPA